MIRCASSGRAVDLELAAHVGRAVAHVREALVLAAAGRGLDRNRGRCPRPSGAATSPSSSTEPDPGLRRPGVAGDVAQGLARDLQQLRPAAVAERCGSFDALVEVDLEVDHGVQPQLLGQRREAADQVGRSRRCGRRPRMKLRMSRDRGLERVDRPVDPGLGLGRVLVVINSGTSSSDRLTRVDGLDDPVVEVLADPLALLDDGQPLDLLVQARVLDRDAGMDARTTRRAARRPRLNELAAAPCRSGTGCRRTRPLTVTGTPEERAHRRVVRREAVRSRDAPRCPGSGPTGPRG